jgi:hypothetical protein
MVCVKYSVVLATLLSTALTAACDPVYEVIRQARLPRLPVVAYVESVIRSTANRMAYLPISGRLRRGEGRRQDAVRTGSGRNL